MTPSEVFASAISFGFSQADARDMSAQAARREAEERDAEAIADAFWAGLTHRQRRDPETIALVRALQPDSVWAVLADDAEVDPPSERTRDLVRSLIAGRIRDSRWGLAS